MKPCKTCPFIKGTTNYGSAEWLEDVIKGMTAGSMAHTCHITDPQADGYLGHKEGKESICVGFVAMMKASENEVYDNRIVRGLVYGDIDWDDIDIKDVFQNPKDMVRHHLNGILEGK